MGKLAGADYWLGFGRRIANWTREQLVCRRLERNKSRLALVNIDESDLSEFGRQVRAEVLREHHHLSGKCDKSPVVKTPSGRDDTRTAECHVVRTYIDKLQRSHAAQRTQSLMCAELIAFDDNTQNDIGLAPHRRVNKLTKGK